MNDENNVKEVQLNAKINRIKDVIASEINPAAFILILAVEGSINTTTYVSQNVQPFLVLEMYAKSGAPICAVVDEFIKKAAEQVLVNK